MVSTLTSDNFESSFQTIVSFSILANSFLINYWLITSKQPGKNVAVHNIAKSNS